MKYSIKEMVEALPPSDLMMEAIFRMMQDRLFRAIFPFSEYKHPEGTLYIWNKQNVEQNRL